MEEVRNLRYAGKNHEAYEVLKKIYDPEDEDMAYEMSIVGYYVGEHEKARLAIDRSLFRKWPRSDNMHANLVWYMVPIKGEKLCLGYEVLSHNACVDLGGPFMEHFTSSTPSIIKTSTGYLVNVRYVNYFIVDGRYTITRHDNVVSTVNAMVVTDKDFKVLRVIDVQDTERTKYPTHIVGLEDIRIAPGGDEQQCIITATVLDYDSYITTPRMLQATVKNGIVCDSKLLAIPDIRRPEKNWVPIEGNKRLFYGFDFYQVGDKRTCYLTLVKPDTNVFETERIRQREGFNADFLRGSTPLIKYTFQGEEGYLAVFHHVTHVKEGAYDQRFYLNRFVFFNRDLVVTHISHCIELTKRRISFVVGLCMDHDMQHVILGYSVMDRTTNFLRVKTDDINELLFSIEKVV